MVSGIGNSLSALFTFGKKLDASAKNMANIDNVDMAKEVTNQIITRRGYEANLAIIRTYDEMLGSVLDIIK